MSNVPSQSNTGRASGIGMPLVAGVLALLGLAGLPLLWGACTRPAALLRYPYPHDGLEGTLLHEAGLLRAGAPLYQPLAPDRFVSAPYPPLHPLVLGLVEQLAGPHVFWGGRLISLCAAIGIAVLIVLIVRRIGGSWVGGLLGVALFLSAPPVILWATRIKPDLLALLWTTLGLYLATRATDDRRPITEDRGLKIEDSSADGSRELSSILYPLSSRGAVVSGRWSVVAGQWSLVGAAVCFVLAFFTKQTAVAAPLAAGLALLVTDVRAFRASDRQSRLFIGHLPLRRRTLAFGLTYAGLALGTWLLLDILTRGQFTAHVWGLHRSEWWSPVLLGKFVALLTPYWPAALLGALLLIRAIRDERVLVPACYVLVVPITLLGAGETGANHNHLLESLLALAIAAGAAAGWAARPTLPLPTAMLVLGLLAAQLALAARPQPWYTRELAPHDPPERFLKLMRATPGEILADDVGLLFAAGKPLRYDDPSTMGPAATSGVWDQHGLLREIAERRFSAIMIPLDVEHQTADPAGRWTPEMIAAIRAYYKLKYRDTIYTYVPRQQ